ncbi:hypothetical protein SD81_039850 [Tolypothrix campylonemoides VB511288]|nr:hypothetical protein SD81_039850 [Tolypothrix campylonemoides VB511288]
MSEIKLLSAVGVDYSRLRNLLVAKDWLNADSETARLILKIVGKNEDSFLYDKDIKQFPCIDLQTIDLLWMYYSAERFGITIQSSLWKTIISIRKNAKADFFAFGSLGYHLGWLSEKGWLNYTQITLDLDKVPKGHFPRWGLSVIPLTGDVTWIPGLLGLSGLSARVRVLGYGVGPRVDEVLNHYAVLSPLCAFFCVIETCNLASATYTALVAINQSQEMQDRINSTITTETHQLDAERNRLDKKNYYTPTNIQKAQKQIITSIAQRQGQAKFRKDLLEAYNYRCVMSDCDAQEALEAAHIIPYCKTEDNDISNGLLLRADLHTLFDLNLITINPENMTVHLAPSLRGTYYEDELHNKSLRPPTNEFYLPSKEALQWRCSQCNWYR